MAVKPLDRLKTLRLTFNLTNFSGNILFQVFYVHESHLIPAMEWRKLLSGQGSQSVRSTEYDGLFFGLILDSTHRYHIERSNFDGKYKNNVLFSP